MNGAFDTFRRLRRGADSRSTPEDTGESAATGARRRGYASGDPGTENLYRRTLGDADGDADRRRAGVGGSGGGGDAGRRDPSSSEGAASTPSA